MSDNKPKNVKPESGSITAWLKKQSKQNLNNPTPTAVVSETQVHFN